MKFLYFATFVLITEQLAPTFTTLEVWVPGSKCQQMQDVDKFADRLQLSLKKLLQGAEVSVECTDMLKKTNFLGKKPDGETLEWAEMKKDAGLRGKIEAVVRNAVRKAIEE